jgi:rRNA-processing protein FCF1
MENLNNHQYKEIIDQEEINYHNSFDIEQKIDRFTFQQIELFLQQQVLFFYLVPSLCSSYYI